MTFSYDATNLDDVGKVRLIIPGETVQTTAAFQDEEIQYFLGMHNNNVLLAAAFGLERIANSQSLLLKKLTIGNGALITDGPTVAKDLREGAALLRRQAAEDDLDWEAMLDIAEWNVGRNYNYLLRNAVYR